MKKRLLILAGGMSSRMKKATNVVLDDQLIEQANTLTKGMIGVGRSGKSLLDYQIMNAQEAGMDEVLLLLHPDDAVTQPYYESRQLQGDLGTLAVRFSRQYIASDRTRPAGTADAVWQALQQHPDWQEGRLIVCNSDNLYSVRALTQLWECATPNALISYDRDALGFPEERIKSFALMKTDPAGYLLEIIEKPTEEEVAAIRQTQGRLGVSMNAFVFDAESVLPYLEKTPFNPLRNEKELPTTVSLMAHDQPKSVGTVPLAEVVPDLTSKHDIAIVQAYLASSFPV
ncbi:sugar phosphate nucleotidyltransferase [Larkinella humicola]|uniref:NTP transferase domain-containing protein n=1 Tax=Larkinella humicola TaxID=2607654 RepID=A0A5N1JDG2_9BACT|nr:sugar phosphate nucleotidyltransferase [Larkinella humicola]KAA9349834.1 NTP transferase domain-containing protein [Larkinella humicola]